VDAISWALKDNDGVLVIEDDVKLSAESILQMIEKLSDEIEMDGISPIIGMSPLASKYINKNFWRTTTYFTAWGFALSNRFWKQHQDSMKVLKASTSVDDYMKNSLIWKQFSKRKKQIWRERILRGNYDYAIQSTLFQQNINVLAPLFRLSDNIGHGDSFSTHTRFAAPLFLRKQVGGKAYEFIGSVQNRFVIKLLVWADSNTWAGDGWLSRRGRTMGLRTFLKLKSRLRDAPNV
jgi:hypothetical protein